jgi:cytidylate kinase
VGSTTTARNLLTYLGLSPWRWVNAGAIMRIFAAELNLSIEEFAGYLQNHPEEKYDERCDEMIRKFGEHDYVIFEGRLVHHFAPNAFHVRLVCDPHIRAERRAKDMPEFSVEEVYKRIVDRDEANRERYKKLYGEDVIWETDQFDLVLDTGKFTPDEIAKSIVEEHKKWILENV